MIGTFVPPCGIISGWHVFRFKTGGKGGLFYNTHAGVETWCKERVKGRWSHVPPRAMNFHTFYFEDKNDAMLFKLTWFTDKPQFKRN